MSYRPYLMIPDLPTSVSVQNQLSRVVRISGIQDIAANATVTISLNNMTEARRLRRWKAIASAVAGSVLAYTAPNALWGTLRVKNLTASAQSLGYGIVLQANEVRDISLVNTTISRRIRIYKAIKAASGAGVLLWETTPASDTPTVTGVSPASLDLAGGTITITGTDFAPGATVSIGGTAATGVTWVNSTTITCVAPVKTAGAKDVVVTNSVGHAGTLTNGLTYTAATFVSVTPNTGSHTGATPVTIVGTNFKPGATVTFGGVAATSVVVVDSSHITAVTPAVAAGAVDVVVTNPGTGGSTATGAGAFTYT